MKRPFICVLMSMFCVFATGADGNITLSDIISGKYNPKSVRELTPLLDGEHYLSLSDDSTCIVRFSFKDGSATDTILNLSIVKGNDNVKRLDGFIVSPKEDRILLQTGTKWIFRHSFTAEYYLFTPKNNKMERLSAGGVQQSPKFSPDGNVIGFVRNGNLFLVKLLFNNAESQVTKDGAKGIISNGVPDWAYEEEFSFTSAFEFSADSKLLAYVRFDESLVNHFNMPYFQTSIEKSEYEQSLLVEQHVKYPVAGAACSKVSVHSFDIKSSVTRDIDLKIDSNTYIPRIQFVEDEENNLFVFTINRSQNKLEVYAANPRSTMCNLVLREEDKRYIETTDYMETKFYGKKFVMQSERDGYNHLYLYNTNGTLIRKITSGKWDVLAFHGYDEKSGTAYYESNEQDPYCRYVYKVDSKGKKTCLTPSSKYNKAVFSTGNRYFINTASDINTPPVISTMDSNGKLIKIIEDNSELTELTAKDGFAKKEMFSFKTSEGIELFGWIVKPSNADASNPCPLIMYQYSGPGANEVINSWDAGFYVGGSFESFLVQNGYAVAVVDGRGTGLRGADFKKQTYMHLGIMESKDQVEAAKYLSTLPYIDAENIGIWGWSYGGYNTLMSMSEGTPVFKAGVAIAPVTDWRYYDAPYTERFMKMPKENGDGYDEASAIQRIENLKGRLLLVHGIDDNNVFFSNTTSYINALIEAGIQFDMQVYPGKEHSLTGNSTRLHLFNKVLEFFNSNLK